MELAMKDDVITMAFEGLDPITFDTSLVNASIATMARRMGLADKLRDMAAIPKKDSKGNVRGVTEAMRREKVQAMATRLIAADATWNERVASVEPPNPTWLAIAAKRGITYEAYVAERVAKDLAELAELNG